MLEDLKDQVYKANLKLVEKGVTLYTWGNVSGIDRSKGMIVIKPSGMPYDLMTPEDMVVVDLLSGKVVEGERKPSTDTPTHLEIYRAFSDVGGITHTHSACAVSFAQAGTSIPALGTTHADYFYGDIPCTRELSKNEVEEAYEKNTGKVIIETVSRQGYDPMSIPAVLVKNHGPFTWGETADDSVRNAVMLEKIAEMAFNTLLLNPNSQMPQYILDKHYFRKHGDSAYYGQEKS